MQFSVAANSFFPILFLITAAATEPGWISLIPQKVPSLPSHFGASLKHVVIEKKLPSNQGFDLVVRDSNTRFTFFKVEGGNYEYGASAKSFSITGGRLLMSKQFANALGRPSDAGSIIGKISVGAAMQPIEIDRVVNGEPQSGVPPAVGTVPGPDVIVGELLDFIQYETGEVNGFVGLALGTDACNKGIQNVGLDCLAEQRPSVYSAKSLPNEWWRY